LKENEGGRAAPGSPAVPDAECCPLSGGESVGEFAPSPEPDSALGPHVRGCWVVDLVLGEESAQRPNQRAVK